MRVYKDTNTGDNEIMVELSTGPKGNYGKTLKRQDEVALLYTYIFLAKRFSSENISMGIEDIIVGLLHAKLRDYDGIAKTDFPQ